MSSSFVLKIVIEVAVVLLLLYGYTQEDRLVAFEDRIRAAILRRLQKSTGKKRKRAADSARKNRGQERRKPDVHPRQKTSAGRPYVA